MLTITGHIHGNQVITKDILPKQYDGHSVTILIADNEQTALEQQLNALRLSSHSQWDEDAQEYITRIRTEDYVR